jgi:predicted nucleic acid-binding protein
LLLVDTSSWIHLLRPSGDPRVRARVERALQGGQACWYPIVRLELWNGAGGEREKKALRDFERLLPELGIDDDVWRGAYELARKARSGGMLIPATDLLIAACAKRHDTDLEHSDSDFDQLGKLSKS